MDIFITGWQVAYRQKPAGTILEDPSNPFCLVPNTWRYMAADPFVFESDGTTYLFAELFDHITLKGIIGCSVWNGRRFTTWKPIIREPYHLSFPNVFGYKGEIYMVPESYKNKEVYCYKAIDFPWSWQRCASLLTGMSCVDTVFFQHGNQNVGLTCRLSTVDGLRAASQLLAFHTDFQTAHFLPGNPLLEGNYGCRPGGQLFRHHDNLIRVSQDCRDSYGVGLIFTEMEPDLIPFREKEIMYFAPDHVRLNGKLKIHGVHTYNGNVNFEVIDVKPMNYNVISVISRLMHKLLRTTLAN